MIFFSQFPLQGLMPVLIVRVAASFLLLLLGALPASAQLIPGWNAKQFTLEQLDADRLRLVNEVEIVGEGPNAGQQIFADAVEWNIRTGEFTATGNVLIVTPTSRLAAERVEYNTKTGLGTFHTASGIASLPPPDILQRTMFGSLEPDIYFYGATIEKIGEDKYRIKNGGFTTCVQPTPRWDIVTGSATINLGDYAILRNAVIRVKDVPVFYLPVMYYPIQEDDRATGFLMPTYGRSSYRGQSLSNAFFWAINRSQDATFFHDLYFSKGHGGGSEYRYMAGPGSEGLMKAYFLNEREATLEFADGNTTTTPARRSYEVSGGMVQALPGTWRARGRIEYFSDITAQQLYHNNIYEASRRQRTINTSVSGSWDALSVTGTFQRTEFFTTAVESYINGYQPSVTASVGSKRLGSLPIYFSLASDASRILSIDKRGDPPTIRDFSLTRMDFSPSVRAALTTVPFFTMNAYFGFRTTYFSHSQNARGDQVAVPLMRRYAEMRADFTGPTFSRVFTPQNAFAERMKHVIEPNFSLSRVTNIGVEQEVPRISNVYDFVVGSTTRMSYGVTSRLLVRRTSTEPGAPASASTPREFLSVGLHQSYYSNPLASQFDMGYASSYGVRPVSNFSPWALLVRTSPTAKTLTSLRVEYDAERGLLQGLSLQGSADYPAVRTSVGWSTKRERGVFRDNTLDTSALLRFRDGRVGGSYLNNWDIGRRTVFQQRLTGFYNAQCCGVAIEYQVYNYPAFDPRFPVASDRRFNLSFTLAGIGTFSNFFGAFGGGRY